MVEMSCEEHDRRAAGTQFITHTVGRMLGELKVCVCMGEGGGG
jgi:arogenate dehydrogenase (NADP+)